LHVHAPSAEHPSPLVPQTVHDPPSTPHAVSDAVMHTLSEQHPFGHESASHVQTPSTQSSIGPQAAPVPHVHVPSLEQLFALDMHWLQAPPLAPHATALGVVHVEPEQHPFGHVSLHPAHAPPLQTSSEGQVLHGPPPVPHMPCTLPGSQVEPLQHPSLQVVPSHTQLPPEQCCPLEHAAPPPHVHAPVDEHPSPDPPHGWQVEPWIPQRGPVGGEVHTLPVQHPSGHDAELQTHTPFEHVCPTAQAALAPQLQTPEGEQLSASLMLQVTHATPSVPQLPNIEVVHVSPLTPPQHPSGHEVELQMQCPATQVCPVPHGPDVPQLHAPAVEQLFALDAAQGTQAAPATPQVVNVDVSHVAPAQHPSGQLVGVQPVQVPASLQFCSEGHAVHPEPPAPHIPVALPGSHVLPEQQPFGHEVPLHTHAPSTHTCSAVHFGPDPQTHAPALEQPLASAPQDTHAAPAVPHASTDATSHTLPWQHPVGHDVDVQAHIPPTHAWPGAHSVPPPHVHAPAVQASDLVASHAEQVTPFTPHVGDDDIVHVVPPTQHPVGHDAASQTHAPPTHACPAAHGAPLPHRHSPAVEHPSAFVASQATHASPPTPHAVGDRALHVGPEQQPVAHIWVQPEHAPAVQVSPAGQLAHALPALPQAVSLFPGSQLLPLQQPEPHETASHTHTPFRHCCPEAHAAAPVPQVHAPAGEHPSEVSAGQVPHVAPGGAQVFSDSGVQMVPSQQPPGQDVASHLHAPPAQCSPGLQDGPAPHWQAPLPEQVSARVGSQAKHVAPPAPHVERLLSLHVVSLQQPVHDVASHTQPPPTHLCPDEHALRPPHAQSPAAEQPSPVVPHAMHAAPPAPHVDVDGLLHVVPVQHPVGHTQLLHAPPVQVSPGMHGPQA
jgi:hypothetical protein